MIIKEKERKKDKNKRVTATSRESSIEQFLSQHPFPHTQTQLDARTHACMRMCLCVHVRCLPPLLSFFFVFASLFPTPFLYLALFFPLSLARIFLLWTENRYSRAGQKEEEQRRQIEENKGKNENRGRKMENLIKQVPGWLSFRKNLKMDESHGWKRLSFFFFF